MTLQLGSDYTGQIGKVSFGNVPNDLSNVAVITVRLMSLSALDLHTTPYKLTLDDKSEVSFSFSRIFAEQLPLHDFKMPPKGRIDFDTFGQLSRSIVEISFSPSQIDTRYYSELTNQELKHKYLSEKAREFLGIFIKQYVQVTEQFWVRPVTQTEVLSYDVEIFFSSAQKAAIRVPIAEMIDTRSESHHLSEEKNDELITALKEPKTDKVKQLIMSAENFKLYEEHELAIVQCALAFEMYIYKHLEIAIEKKITTISQVKKHKKKDKKVDGCSCHVGIQKICEIGLKNMLDIDFGNTEEFDAMRSNVILLRNNIVHGNDISVDADSAELAISSTKNALNYLAKEFVRVGF